jgi:hypothetical protein
MKELKSKLTGRISIISEQEYADIVNKRVIDLNKFRVTDIKTRPVVSSVKMPDELTKIIKKPKNEG